MNKKEAFIHELRVKQFFRQVEEDRFERKSRRKSAKRRGVSRNFYRTKKWRALRRKVLEQYGYKCMRCESVGTMHVDHIKPISKRPELALDISNLQVLCDSCNVLKSNKNSIDFRNDAVARDLDAATAREAQRWL